MSLKKIQTKLKYEFKNIELLELALTHKSSNNFLNNERLEFLGDSILNSVISMFLFKKFPLGPFCASRIHPIPAQSGIAISYPCPMGD